MLSTLTIKQMLTEQCSNVSPDALVWRLA